MQSACFLLCFFYCGDIVLFPFPVLLGARDSEEEGDVVFLTSLLGQPFFFIPDGSRSGSSLGFFGKRDAFLAWRTGEQPSRILLEPGKASGVAKVVGVAANFFPCLRPLLLFFGTAGVDSSWEMVGAGLGDVGAGCRWSAGVLGLLLWLGESLLFPNHQVILLLRTGSDLLALTFFLGQEAIDMASETMPSLLCSTVGRGLERQETL